MSLFHYTYDATEMKLLMLLNANSHTIFNFFDLIYQFTQFRGILSKKKKAEKMFDFWIINFDHFWSFSIHWSRLKTIVTISFNILSPKYTKNDIIYTLYYQFLVIFYFISSQQIRIDLRRLVQRFWNSVNQSNFCINSVNFFQSLWFSIL